MATWVKVTEGDQQVLVNLDHAVRIEKIRAPKEMGNMGTRIFFAYGGPISRDDDQFIVVEESPEQLMKLAEANHA